MRDLTGFQDGKARSQPPYARLILDDLIAIHPIDRILLLLENGQSLQRDRVRYEAIPGSVGFPR